MRVAALLPASLLALFLTACTDAGPPPCRGRILFQDAAVGICLEQADGEGWFEFERYRVVAREQRSEQVLISSGYGGDFAAQRLEDGTLVVASSWMIAVRTEARTWLSFVVSGDERAAPRLRDALRWMAANPRFFVDGRIRAAVNLVELGDPQGTEWIARLGTAPDLGWQQRDVLLRGRASSAWR